MFLRYEACPRCRSNGHDNRGDNLGRYSDGSGHCFSCGYHEHSVFAPVFHEPTVDDGTKSLRPSDFTRDVPTKCLQWLLQFGLPYTYWQPTIGYSGYYQRLVFEVYVEEKLAFSIGRYFGDESKRKWHVWGDCHEYAYVLFGTNYNEHSPIVLVEDLISCHKVNQAGFTCIPLFGTNVHKPALYFLQNQTAPVVLWLDKDQELNMKKQAMRLESLVGGAVSVRVTDLDPKMLSFKQINEVIYA